MPRVRVVEIDSEADALAQLGEIGVSRPGQRIMSGKAVLRVLRVDSLGSVALSILKQEMLSLGAEAGIPQDAYYLQDQTGQALLMATRAQYRQLVEKLRRQPTPLGLGLLADEIATALHHYDELPTEWHLGTRSLSLQRRPYLIGVLPFGTRSNESTAVLTDRARRLVEAGAEIVELDLGPAGTSRPLTPDGQARLTTVIESVAKATGAIIAMATGDAAGATLAIRAGAAIIVATDQSQLAALAAVVAQSNVGLIAPPAEGSSITERLDSLTQSLTGAQTNGVDQRNIALDLGQWGTGSVVPTVTQIKEFRLLGAPLVLTVPSRHLNDDGDFADEDAAVVGAGVAIGSTAGVRLLRVSNVTAAERAVSVLFP